MCGRCILTKNLIIVFSSFFVSAFIELPLHEFLLNCIKTAKTGPRDECGALESWTGLAAS